MKNDTDFIAQLTYRTMEEGGRKTPARSGYRPQIRFSFSDMQTSGQQTFIDKEFVMPGDCVEAEIRILGVEYFAGQLYEGLAFDFSEGSRIIGTGIITSIVNEQLKSKADQPATKEIEEIVYNHTETANDTKLFRIKKTAGMSVEQLYAQISYGGRIVIYGYCISAVFLTFRLISPPYYIRPGEKASKYRSKYNLLSLLMGWWGLPWGPIHTLEMLRINSDKQGGATDVTDDVLSKLKEKYTCDAAKKISDTDITIEYFKNLGTSNRSPRS